LVCRLFITRLIYKGKGVLPGLPDIAEPDWKECAE
jgi:hypothetical protein